MGDERFCQDCGELLQAHVISGVTRNHWFCASCAKAVYDHPMIVVTSFVSCQDRLLWVQRALEPKRGLWAIPGGYLESGESLAQGAARELHEEAGILLPPERLQLYMTGTLAFINQIYFGFRATVDTEYCDAGEESLDCRFYSREDCPWQGVAYPEVNNTIEQVYDDLELGVFDVWHAEMTADHFNFRPVLSR